MSDAPVILRANSLSYSYGSEKALSNISLEVRRGECIAVLGRNGSGKSTLLKSLAGILALGQGEVLVDGFNLMQLDSRVRAQKISYHPQVQRVDVPFTVFDFALMSRYPYVSALRDFSADDKDRVEEILLVCGLQDFKQRTISSLSGGERQLVYLASAMVQDPEVLLLDEPGSFLDPNHKGRILSVLQRFLANGEKTIIWATHEINEVFVLADRVLGLNAGKLTFDLPPSELSSSGKLSELYDFDFDIYHLEASGGSRESVLYPRYKKHE